MFIVLNFGCKRQYSGNIWPIAVPNLKFRPIGTKFKKHAFHSLSQGSVVVLEEIPCPRRSPCPCPRLPSPCPCP